MTNKITIDQSRYNALADEFQQSYFHDLEQKLREEETSYTIYPPAAQRFTAFDLYPLESVRVVILGQDPYHRPGQAM